MKETGTVLNCDLPTSGRPRSALKQRDEGNVGQNCSWVATQLVLNDQHIYAFTLLCEQCFSFPLGTSSSKSMQSWGGGRHMAKAPSRAEPQGIHCKAQDSAFAEPPFGTLIPYN